ncbi:DUF1768-domain-containing protein [Plenodomus tracheiphilus IPT5]|uniref:DUF1768-domain-containing protein n=1 Tax=Plenodomus tracheiphilus IPT5 TaxID=1408161 RepID=A0A6A7BBI3_9PLEO|nr:DUF1768-domain-containing protein [Plenodomus tracheiphilus IPT5]
MPFSTASQSKIAANPPSTTSTITTSTNTTEPVYFWRPKDAHGWLGQWHASPFFVEGEKYATAEMWMMVCKARLFGDEDIARQMLNTTSPGTHKALGRKVKGFKGDVWDERKLDIVIQGNYHKFTLSKDAADLSAKLLATGDRELVEASPLDRVWGVGFAPDTAEANRGSWGENLLGKALMSVRTRLREEAKEKVGGGV